MKSSYTATKYASFLTGISMAVPSVLSPLLFTTFNKSYGISYTLLGFLVVLNFGTQLLLDLIYSFLSHKLNLKLSVKLTPASMCTGLILYALSPTLFPSNIYIGLAAGTVIFSAGCGLAEVLISPVVAAIPSDNPDRLMSKLHSCYAWGTCVFVIFATVFILLFGSKYWQILTFLLTSVPFISFILMLFSDIPDIKTGGNNSASKGILKNKIAVLYIIGIFFAGASEITMCQWCSGYLEVTFGINKTVGDLLGLALFGGTLGLGRSLYAKFGKNIDYILFYGSMGAILCYGIVTFSTSAVLGLIACGLTGFFVSMLWPGSLIAVTDRIPNAGVGLFALMATGGDLGATLYPQAVGFITDKIMLNDSMTALAQRLNMSPEQLGMRGGMLFAILAPLIGTLVFYCLIRNKK